MQYGYTLHGHQPTSTIGLDGKATTTWAETTTHCSLEIVQPEKRDSRLDDPGVMEWIRQLQRTLEIRNRLEREGKPSMKSAVEQVIMEEFGISHQDAHHIMNVIEYRNLLVPADVAKAYKIKLD